MNYARVPAAPWPDIAPRGRKRSHGSHGQPLKRRKLNLKTKARGLSTATPSPRNRPVGPSRLRQTLRAQGTRLPALRQMRCLIAETLADAKTNNLSPSRRTAGQVARGSSLQARARWGALAQMDFCECALAAQAKQYGGARKFVPCKIP